MASIINAATSGGLISTGDTSGQLQLQTAGTTALTISSAQAITVNGLITSTVGNSGFILRGSTATNSYIYPVYVTNTSGGVQLALEGASGGNVLVGGTAYATILTTTTNTPVEIGINTTRVGSFSSTGLSMVKSVGVGNTTPSSSGAGIAFPATQSASSDANTLDDYEEGTFTVTFVPSTSGSISLSDSTCTYTKVGRAVTITGLLTVSSVSSPTGYLKIAGLPFGGGGATAPFRLAVAIEGENMNVTMTTVLTATIQGDTNIYVFKPDGVGGVSATTAADMKATSQLFIGGTYIIN